MKKYIFIFFLLVVGSVFGIGKKEKPVLTAKTILNIVEKINKHNSFNGVVLIGDRDSIITCFADGYSNFEYDELNTEVTIFNTASLSKQFTAVSILLLEECGKLSTTDTVARYLPEYPYASQITIHQLLTHSAGVPNYNFFKDYDLFSKRNTPREEVIDWIGKRPLDFEPGTDFEYSNSGYFLLARIIEKVSGKTYREFLKINLFNPAQMKNTDNYSTTEIIKNRADRYKRNNERIVKAEWFDNSFKIGSGSIYSTVVDLYKWYKTFMDDEIISHKSIDKMFTNYVEGYGYGIGKGDNEREFYEHEGIIPGMNAYMAYFFEPEYVLIMWSNIESENFWKVRDELRNFLVNCQ